MNYMTAKMTMFVPVMESIIIIHFSKACTTSTFTQILSTELWSTWTPRVKETLRNCEHGPRILHGARGGDKIFGLVSGFRCFGALGVQRSGMTVYVSRLARLSLGCRV